MPWSSTPLQMCLRHPRSPFKERGQDTTQPYRLSGSHQAR